MSQEEVESKLGKTGPESLQEGGTTLNGGSSNVTTEEHGNFVTSLQQLKEMHRLRMAGPKVPEEGAETTKRKASEHPHELY